MQLVILPPDGKVFTTTPLGPARTKVNPQAGILIQHLKELPLPQRPMLLINRRPISEIARGTSSLILPDTSSKT